MIPVARFYSREEADEMAALAAEAGIFAPVVDPKRLPRAFDATLGGFDAALGFSVYVNPEDVDKLRGVLEATLTIDPQDPLCSLATDELAALAQGPVDANLAEQVIAGKLLAAPAASTDESSPQPAAAPDTPPLDPHAVADVRRGYWIGGLALVFPLICLVLFAPSVWQFASSPGEAVVWQTLHIHSTLASAAVDEDSFATPIRMFIVVLIPLAASGTLAFSRRQLRDGTSRPMFSRAWRITGGMTLVFVLAVYLIPLAWVYWSLISNSSGPDPG